MPKERVWVRARPVLAWVPVLQETWKPQIKVRRVRYPAGHSLMPGWRSLWAAWEVTQQEPPQPGGGTRLGAAASGEPCRPPHCSATPSSAAPSGSRPEARSALSRGPRGPGRLARPGAPNLSGGGGGRAHSSRQLREVPGEHGGRGGLAASARRDWGPRNARCLASVLCTERTQDDPKFGAPYPRGLPDPVEKKTRTERAFVGVWAR